MPKLKTKSAVKKRISLTGSGKVKNYASNKRHCLSTKSQSMKRKARGVQIMDETTAKTTKAYYLPYGV